jgi:hypothetical protein
VEEMLTDRIKLNHLKKQLFALREVMGGAGASDRVAELALGMLPK